MTYLPDTGTSHWIVRVSLVSRCPSTCAHVVNPVGSNLSGSKELPTATVKSASLSARNELIAMK